MGLLAAKHESQLDRKLRALERYDLLLVDELGYIPFERKATDLLFQVISRRYERQSVAISTNLAFTDWTNIFPDPMAATAVIDRLVHHGAVSSNSPARANASRPASGAGKARTAAKIDPLGVKSSLPKRVNSLAAVSRGFPD